MQLSSVKLSGYMRNRQLVIKGFWHIIDIASIGIIIYSITILIKAAN